MYVIRYVYVRIYISHTMSAQVYKIQYDIYKVPKTCIHVMIHCSILL